MGDNQLELRHIESILAVAKYASFDKAAWQLSYTESAVSKHIAAAEKKLGMQLFERKGRSAVSITQDGEKLLPYLQGILEKYEQLNIFLRQTSIAGRKVLNIGSSDALVPVDLTPAIAACYREHPDIIINHAYANSRQNLLALLSGELDLVAIAMEDEDPKVLLNDPLFLPVRDKRELILRKGKTSYPLTLAVKKGHPALSNGKVCLQNLQGETFLFKAIMSSVEQDKRVQSFIESCRDLGFEPRLKYIKNVNSTIFSLIVDGMGVAPVFTRPRIEYPGVEFVTVDDSPYYRTRVLLYLRSNSNPALRSFLPIADAQEA